MNRNRYRLVFNAALGMMVPVAETARRAGKSGSGKAAGGSALALAGVLLGAPAWAELPVASVNYAGPGTTANFVTNGATQAYMNQVGKQAIVNFDRFNLSAGHGVQLRQVHQLPAGFNDPAALVAGAQFSTLARIHDLNPSVIAGSLSQAAGQKANLILVNTNGIAFMGGSQVNLNSFTASSLNIDDKFVLGDFLQKIDDPQFVGDTGFIKVFEGANITAGSQGRVMLIAPTVVNKGTITAPDGQTILAAGQKVYLRASGDNAMRGLLVEVDTDDAALLGSGFDTPNTTVRDGELNGQTVALTNAAEDKLGHATNAGTLTAARGNVTMAGYAVNQNHIARATSTVVANGSIYLQAKDINNNQLGSVVIANNRGGRVTLGAGSSTEVMPELNDTTTSLDTRDASGTLSRGMAQASRVLAIGQEVRVAGGAAIDVPSGVVDLVALDSPGAYQTVNDPLTIQGSLVSATARVHVAEGARISVAGLGGVKISAARNAVEVELRGDELKDTPVNQQGPLRGEKVWVDLDQALANANAGKSTLIAKDSLESYQAKIERTAAERSSSGGRVNIHSQGEAILQAGALIDLSGGSIDYTPANVKTTLLSSGGKIVDLANADAETRYDGISTRYVIDYGRWNRQEVIDLGQSFRFDPGYVEGKDAGTMNLTALGTNVLQADIAGRTVTGERQRAAGLQPLGAQLVMGSVSDNTNSNPDINFMQRVELTATAALLPRSFGFGDALPTQFANTFTLDTDRIGKDKLARVQIFTGGSAAVNDAVSTPQGGSLRIDANGINVNADIRAPGGSIELNARDLALANADLTIANGATVAARGNWVNDVPGQPRTPDAPMIHGGSVKLKASGDVVLGADSALDVTAGAHLGTDGKLAAGNGGSIALDAGGRLSLGGRLRALAPGKGGSLALKTGQQVRIDGTAAVGELALDPAFFADGGFASYAVTGVGGLSIADGTTLAPVLASLDIDSAARLAPSGQAIETLSRAAVRENRVRQAVNLAFAATGKGGAGLRLGEGARVQADDRAQVSFTASERLDLLGEVVARGGTIAATLTRNESGEAFNPASALWLGDNARLDVSGVARTYTDTRGLTQGTVLAGGSVTLAAPNGSVVTAAGSQIDVSGAAPVRFDVPNESGGLGRMVGSDAGTFTARAREGVMLDGGLNARAGSAAHRGGRFVLALEGAGDPNNTTGLPVGERVVHLTQTLAPQATGLSPGDSIPLAAGTTRLPTRLATAPIEAAGFERIELKSDALRLENNYSLGAARAVPLRDLVLGGRVETDGSDARLAAHRVAFVPAVGAPTPAAPVTGTGTLRVDATRIDIEGLHLSGMARAEFNGSEAIQLGVSGLASELKAAADLAFHGAVVAPAMAARFTLDATGHRVQFSRNTDTPLQPFSALGSLTVKADNIVQGGNLWAPLGQLDFQATNTLEFANGSLTSVAAQPGSLLPYGQTANGREWRYAQNLVSDLPEKAIRTRAAEVDMQPGAKVQLAGGGDLQAWEFTVGPGGGRDILADKNTYAILPGAQRGFAPADAQEGFDRAPGEAVYLSGVPGLADGVYTLLPAHYALLPGAYAVKLDTGVGSVLPGQAYSRQDGVRIAAGYVTDTRAGAPRDAHWQGVQVMTRDQVRARSEFTLTRASNFFADSRNRPQDAGLLSVDTTGSGAQALKLDAIYSMAAASGGRGAQVDIAALKLAVRGNAPASFDPDAVVLDAGKLNALGAESLFLGGTRSASGETTTLNVNADTLTFDNAGTPLRAGEILLAAKDTLEFRAGSALDAQGTAGDAGTYHTSGNGALVRAAATQADFARTGSPDGSAGTLIGAVGSSIVAADSIVLDATRTNDFKGNTTFARNGVPTAGRFSVGATRINLGAAPAGAEGLSYSQADLDSINLAELTLISYSTFDLYGDVRLGQKDGNGKPLLQNLTLQGAGLAGIDNAGQTAQINAKQLTLANPNNAAAFVTSGALGSGALAITADTLTLGAGDKAVRGFGNVQVTANELLAGSGTGTLTVDAPLTLNVTRVSGTKGADQSLNAAGALVVASHTADRALAPVSALGAKWALQGSTVDFDSRAELPSGQVKFTATTGDVTLGANARVDVAGRSVKFFDVEKPSWGGTAEFVSTTGDVVFGAGAQVDVSAAAGGDAGTLIVRAADGTFTVAAGSVKGAAPTNPAGKRGEGARADIDVGTLADFSALNTALNGGLMSGAHGFDGERSLRVRRGDLTIAASDTVKARNIRIALDGGDPLLADGNLTVDGALDASAGKAGRIELFARNNASVNGSARLDAASSNANQDGGDIAIGTRDGVVRLETGSTVDVSGGTGGRGGTLTLRAARNGTDVNVGALDSTISGARDLFIEAVRVYDNINTLTATGASSGSTLSLSTITADNTTFATGHSAIKTRLGRPAARILSGVEVRSAGNLTLNNDWNLATARAGGEAGVLTLRAAGNLLLNNNLSDGFSHATPYSSGTTPATLLAGDSWAYRLVAGADTAASDALAVSAGTGDVTLAAGKLVRTGTGDIRIAAGRDIRLASAASAIYTAGKLTPPPAGFVVPSGPSGAVNFAQFSTGGGDVALSAQRDLVGARATQLYSQWLFRQGMVNAATGDYATQPAQWVRFDQFQQGVGALGGGDVRAVAGRKVEELSASAATQHYTTATRAEAANLTVTGGGDVRVEAGDDIVGGQFYAARGALDLRAGGDIKAGNSLATIVALGDAQASLRAQGDATVHSAIDPLLIRQTTGSTTIVNATGGAGSTVSGHRWAIFTGYSPDSRLDMSTLTGDATLQNGSFTSYTLMTGSTPTGYSSAALNRLRPASLGITALQGSVSVDGNPVMFASPQGGLDLLGADSVTVVSTLGMSAARSEVFPGALNPVQRNSSTFEYLFGMGRREDQATLLHAGDATPARVYATAGDVTGTLGRHSLNVPKPAEVRAGRDVRNFSVIAQHPDAGSVSRVLAGRDVRFDSSQVRNPSRIWVGGVGRLEVEAGRDIDLGTSDGIVARGDLDNPRLPSGGLDIQLLAGAGAGGLDVAGTLSRLITNLGSGSVDDASLWQARWLTGDASLTSATALPAVQGIAALPAGAQRDRVRAMVFTALRETGRDANRAESGFAGDFARGYATLALVFPGIEEKNPDGTFKHYAGDINLFASRVKTERGGNIEFMLPGGDLIVGLANTPNDLVNVGNNVLGIVAAEAGDVQGFARGNMLVNQSRILTVGGGDVLLWSSEGDVDAGRGKKTATAVPPPIIKVDAQGNVTQEFQGAVTGSGIGALALPGVTAGDVDLIAPKGTVNAGDAGIRAGNLNIAAQVVLGADNISVSGTSTGTPVADTSAVTAASSGASNAGGDVSATTAALAGNLADAARAAEELKKSFRPTFISAEVIGYGE